MADVIDQAARVRLNRLDVPVHAVTADWSMHGIGVYYATGCRRVLSSAEGALLTTRPVSCLGCMAVTAPDCAGGA